MIGYGRSDKEFYCFTKDAPTNGYQVLHVELVRQKENEKAIWIPQVHQLRGLAVCVGTIQVEVFENLGLVDLATFPKETPDGVKQARLKAGYHTFDWLHVELPLGANIRFIDLAVLPRTVIGTTLATVVKYFTRTVCNEIYWSQKSQFLLPFDAPIVTIA
jgi:hypothetical protein